MIYCPSIPPYGGDTLFSFNAISYNIFLKKFGSYYDEKIIVNTMPEETEKLLKLKYPNDSSFETSCQKPLVREFDGVKVFLCNKYHTLPSKQKINGLDKEILNVIFSIQESNLVTKNLSWQHNQMLIWNNDLVLHKASNDYDGFEKIIWRILIER